MLELGKLRAGGWYRLQLGSQAAEPNLGIGNGQPHLLRSRWLQEELTAIQQGHQLGGIEVREG